MANDTTSNPKTFDTTTGATISGRFGLRLIQWIDEGGDLADQDDLVFDLNGVTFTYKYEKPSDVGFGPIVIMQIGPFNPTIPVRDFTLTTLDRGTLHVWTS